MNAEKNAARDKQSEVREKSQPEQNHNKLLSESTREGSGRERNDESKLSGPRLVEKGTLPSLQISGSADRVHEQGKRGSGAPEPEGDSGKGRLSVLTDPHSSAADKLRAAKDMSSSGQKSFEGQDGRKYDIHAHDYGKRSGVVISTTDNAGKYTPVLRGLIDKEGNVSHQKDERGHQVSYEGKHAGDLLAGDHSRAHGTSKLEPPERKDGKPEPTPAHNSKPGADARHDAKAAPAEQKPEEHKQEKKPVTKPDEHTDSPHKLDDKRMARMGQELAHKAEKTADQIHKQRHGKTGDCARGPRKTFDQLGFHLDPAIATRQGKMIEQHSELFRQVPLSEARPGDYGYRHWNQHVARQHGGVDKGDSFIVTHKGRRGELHGANDHRFQVPPDGGRYQGLKIFRPLEKFFEDFGKMLSGN